MTKTDTYRITAVVPVQFRRGRRFNITAHPVDRPTGCWDCYSWNQFVAAACEEAKNSRRVVEMTTESRWWGEEITQIEVLPAEDDETAKALGIQ